MQLSFLEVLNVIYARYVIIFLSEYNANASKIAIVYNRSSPLEGLLN